MFVEVLDFLIVLDGVLRYLINKIAVNINETVLSLCTEAQ